MKKKHEHSSGVFNKVKNALNILKKLHKDKGKSTKAETKAAKVDSAALFEQAMASGTSNDEDEEKKNARKNTEKDLMVFMENCKWNWKRYTRLQKYI